MTVRICFDAEEKMLQQHAFAYDKWSVSHFLRVTMGVDPWVDRGTCPPPYFLNWRGRPVFIVPLLSGG